MRSPAILRTAHGSGESALLRAEAPPLDEIPPLNADLVAQGAAIARVRGRPFQRGNAAAKGRKPAMATLGVSLNCADVRYRKCLRKAASWRRRRCAELARDHGGYLSAGASAIVATAALALAASRYLYELAGDTGNAALLVKAADLGDKARSAELTAIGVAEREGAARNRARDPRAVQAERMAATSTGNAHPLLAPDEEPTP